MHEYRVVPAPGKAGKVKGLRTTAERFAHALAEVLNEHAAEGWEFVRTETYTVEDRRGLFSRPVTSTQTVLILRRDRPRREAAPTLRSAAAPAPMPPPVLAAEPAPEPPPPPPAPEPAVAELRAEPAFRPGTTLRTDGVRKYPPLRRAGAESAASDSGR